jgi:long-subunit acyl-CoA synthetase (AMP-forming)
MDGLDKDGWYVTGDIGFFDDDGNIYIKERTSFLFKYLMFIVSTFIYP